MGRELFGTHPPSLGSYGATRELWKMKGQDRINRMDRIQKTGKGMNGISPRMTRIERIKNDVKEKQLEPKNSGIEDLPHLG